MRRRRSAPLRISAVRSPLPPVVWLLVVALAAAALLAGLLPAAAHAGPGGARLDMRLERTDVIARHDYGSLPPMDPSGAIGGNRRGGGFQLADQSLGDLWVRAGLVHGDPSLIRRGFDAFDYAFRRQRDGDWGRRQIEEYAFVVEAVAHSGLLIRVSPYAARFRDKLRRYAKRLRSATRYMTSSGPFGEFADRNRSYTHSGYRVGAALGLAAKFTGVRSLKRYGRSAIRLALSRQRRSGVNPELGGYDVRYQMVGLAYAERFVVYFPRGDLSRRVARMTSRGLGWMRGRVADSGYIHWAGSSRTCREMNSLGRPKTPGYNNAIRGFAYWAALKGWPNVVEEAEAMDRYTSEHSDALCDGEREMPPPDDGGGDGGDVGSVELLPQARVSDLVE